VEVWEGEIERNGGTQETKKRVGRRKGTAKPSELDPQRRWHITREEGEDDHFGGRIPRSL
jgi:hypothetical protein